MSNPILKIAKLHPDAVYPKIAHPGDAGMDLTAIDDGVVGEDGRYIEYRTGISVELPPGHHGLIHPRSSVSKYDLLLCNSVGLVDNGYRGELIIRFKVVPPVELDDAEKALPKAMHVVDGCFDYPVRLYKKGDRIAQLVIAKTPEVEIQYGEVSTDTSRATGGFGSTGV